MKLLTLISFAVSVCSTRHWQERRFPKDFLFGVATAAYQIEGGWNADDKGESIWDHLSHTRPELVKDRSNADIAANSYTNYKRDVEMMRELGLNAYRFSLSWPRILPNGLSNKVSAAGVAFYNNYINEMLKYNITPIVTLYHWDMPQKLQDLGGFISLYFSEWFEDYARVAYENFGDRVKHWITFNEPREICLQGYSNIKQAPAINVTDVGVYYCAKNLVISHARAYYAYVNDFKSRQGGICGITISCHWFGPLTDSADDQIAAELRRQAEWGLYAEPIFSEYGGFPREFSQVVAEKSAKQGYKRSRMPEFTHEEREFVRGAADFFGVNYYTANLVSATKYIKEYPVPSLYDDLGVGAYVPPEWIDSASYWLKFAPKYIYNSITLLHKRYNKPIFYITENGWSQRSEGLEDDVRIKYYRSSLNSVLDAMEDGVDLRGYMAWSLMDNFEWIEGYTERFGLYEVDFESPHRTRTPRKSAFVYKQIIKTRVIEPDYEPNTFTMWINEGNKYSFSHHYY